MTTFKMMAIKIGVSNAQFVISAASDPSLKIKKKKKNSLMTSLKYRGIMGDDVFHY